MKIADLNQKILEQTSLNEEQLNEILKQVDGKWALVSKTTGKPLRYYKGEGKPSKEWVAQQEREIHFFKNQG
jgi:hypothetical protein